MTYNDFVMESAMVETTSATEVSDIQMEQLVATMNVAEKAIDCLNKYSMIQEYATCDPMEFYEESAGEWLKSKAKGIGSVIKRWAEAALDVIKSICRWFVGIFKPNTFASLKKKFKHLEDDKNLQGRIDVTATESLDKNMQKFQAYVEAYGEILAKFNKNESSATPTNKVNEITKVYNMLTDLIEKLDKGESTAPTKQVSISSKLDLLEKQSGETSTKTSKLLKILDLTKTKFMKDYADNGEFVELRDDEQQKVYKNNLKEGGQKFNEFKDIISKMNREYTKIQNALIKDYQVMLKQAGKDLNKSFKDEKTAEKEAKKAAKAVATA